MTTETHETLDDLAQWVWSNREPTESNNYARYGQWVAVEFDGGGVCSVHCFDTPKTAQKFIRLVESPHERNRLKAWDMVGLYEVWDREDEYLDSMFPVVT